MQGATRAFPPHHPLIPVDYQLTGQPVLIGGTMGTCSYVLTGTEVGMQETFGSTCHGAVSFFFFTHTDFKIKNILILLFLYRVEHFRELNHEKVLITEKYLIDLMKWELQLELHHQN